MQAAADEAFGARFGPAVVFLLLSTCFAGFSALYTNHPSLPSGTEYKLEQVVKFRVGGDSEFFRRGGWGESERFFTWTVKRRAKLKLSLAPLKGPLGIRMRLLGNVDPPELPYQMTELWVNGHKVTVWWVAALNDFQAIVPAELIGEDGKMLLELRIPMARKLKSSVTPDDPRLFGIACFELEVSRAGESAADVR